MLTLQIPLNSNGKKFEFDLNQSQTTTIGRRHDNDVRIKETYVSAYHAEFTRSRDRLVLKDRGSANGTFVNGKRVKGSIEVDVGDRIKFGSLPCYLVETSDAEEAVADLVGLGSGNSQITELKALLAKTQDELKSSRAEILKLRTGDENKPKGEVLEVEASELHEMLNLTDSLTKERNQTTSKLESLSSEFKQLKAEFNRSDKALADKTDRLGILESENRQLQSENQKLREKNLELEELQKEITRKTSKVEQLQGERTDLEKQARLLRSEKEKLTKDAKTAYQEMEICEETYQTILKECEQASHKLDKLSQQLNDSEKKVNYLRNLEEELEKSVRRAHRSNLSRRGIYSENNVSNDDVPILPEAEQMICREVIDRLDLLEDMLKSYQKSWLFPNKVADQLNLLRDSFNTLLKRHSVDEFNFEPGTEISSDARRKIQLISAEDFGDPKLKKKSERFSGKKTTVLETVRSGYVYSKDGLDVIIRKAEVIVA